MTEGPSCCNTTIPLEKTPAFTKLIEIEGYGCYKMPNIFYHNIRYIYYLIKKGFLGDLRGKHEKQ